MTALELADRLNHGLRDNNTTELSATMLRKQAEAIKTLREALTWYVEEDDVNEGDSDNEFWIEGKRNAESALAATKEFE
jgi:hypothetical protein